MVAIPSGVEKRQAVEYILKEKAEVEHGKTGHGGI